MLHQNLCATLVVMDCGSPMAGFDGAEVLTDQTYDVHGRLSSKSLPYKSGSSAAFINYSYDNYDRITHTSAPSGSQTSYSYSGTGVTETTNGVTGTKNFDASGELLSVTNNAGTISYNLRPDGQPSSISAPGGANTSFSYDSYGRQTAITDPSAGTVTYSYDAAGNLNKTTNAKGESINSTFDNFNRLTGKTTPELTSTYTYNTDGMLTGITNSNGTSKTLTYDNLGRVTQSKEQTGTEYYQINYTYQNGRITSVVHQPVNYTVNYVYNSYGYLNKLTNASGTAIKTISKINANGQLEQVTLGNGLVQTNTYNAYGLLTGIKTANGATNIQNMSYTMNNAKGLVDARKDVTRNLTETFQYDALMRLTHYGPAAAQKTVTYNNATGNILTKSDAGTYKYTITGKPYTTSSVTSNGSPLPTAMQQITYTSFSRPKKIAEGTYTADFVYDERAERATMVIKNNNSTVYTRYYFAGGQFEKTVQGSTVKTILYLDGSPYDAAVALETNAGVSRLLYISRDHLGSITHITDAGKALQAEYSYDAWGRMRNPVNLTVYALGAEPALLLNRGYTGHEHLKEFGLINMNARLYDALIGRMISPDNYVQDPSDPRNFNRYAYAMNNPLKYTDPTGEFWHLIIGAVIGGITNWAANGAKFSWKGLGYFGIGAVAGALSAGIGTGVNVAMAGGSFGAGFMGTAVGVSSTGFIAGAATGAAAGFTGGFVTNSGNAWMSGANLGQGLWAGIKGGGIGALAGSVLSGTIGGINALTKGTNFWTGKASFDLSNGYSACGTAVGDKTVTGKYVGKFRGINLYESSMLPEGSAATLPGRGIILSTGQYSLNSTLRYTTELLQHEFGHILQAREVGFQAFYKLIAPESFASATLNGVGGWSHSTFWTETWANYLSNNYFGVNSLLNNPAWPAQNISWYNLLRLSAVSPFFLP